VQPAHIAQRRQGEAPSILFAGQIVREKGVLTLVRALAILRRSRGLEHTRLTLLGTLRHQDYAAELRGEIARAGLDSAITITTLPRAEVSTAYASHDVLAFTSEWQEPFSLTLLEAMASGMPVVSSLTGGSAEIVRDGENALAFAAGEADDLAAKLARVLSDPQLGARLGQTAASQIRQTFTLERQVAAVERYLQQVAGGS
jgi:glycosyltransferase involved in cell wall biosynthesis